MRLKNFISFVFYIILLTLVGKLQATHLVGGQLSYKYLGTSSITGFDRYLVTMFVYRDCAAGTDAVPFDEELTLCIFENNGPRKLHNSIIMTLDYDRKVEPIGNTNCPEVANTCLRQGRYTEEISLPNSNFGYILKWERCCRNTQNNLAELSGGPDQGQTYIAYIPPSSFKNSSPEFSEVPVPFICVNDTTSIRNFAVDKDGDSLSYHFVIPYQGANTTTAVSDFCESTMPANQNVVYKSGYSFTNPFGTGGIATIDSYNGLTTYLSQSTGRFAVAIEVREWRKGIVISRIRLDLQILVIQCKPNKLPNVSYNNPSNNKWYVTAGEKICKDVTGFDDDNQNIALTAYSNLFSTDTNLFKGTRATFTPNPAVGFKTAVGEFCWDTDCNQGRVAPYLVTFEVVDDGCPSKFRNVNIEIYVKPFDPKDAPTGPTNVCQYQKNVQYSIINATANVNHQWTVNGGTIIGGSTGNTITVDWGNQTAGEVILTTSSADGCIGIPQKLAINIIPSPAKPTIVGTDTVCLNATTAFISTPVPNIIYIWTVSGGTFTLGGGVNNSNATVLWNTKGNNFVSIQLRNTNGCLSLIDTHWVYVSHPDNTGIDGPDSICPNNKNIEYIATPIAPGSTYNWLVTGGAVNNGQGSSPVYIDWGNKGLGTLTVTETDRLGCIGDPFTLNVTKDHALPGQVPRGDSILCENELNVPYSISKINGESYEWFLTGNVSFNSSNIEPNIRANFGIAGNAQVGVQATAYDSVNNLPCFSPIIYKDISIKPYPVATPIIGEYELCQTPKLGIYSVAGFANSNYQWQVIDLPFTGNNTNQIQFSHDTFGTFTLKVQETTEFGCVGPINDTTVIIHPKPRTTPITGPDIICFPNYSNHMYAVTGFTGSRYNWQLTNGQFFGANNTSSVVVDWNGNPNAKITVFEISSFGCKGDTQVLDIFADNPQIEAENLTVNPPPNSDKNILFSFNLLNAPRYNNSIYIQRKISGVAGNFINIDAVAPNSTNYTDTKVQTDDFSYTYRPVAINLCGDSVFGNTMQDILLKGSRPTPFMSKISFSEFIGWPQGVEKYELYRALEGKTDYELYRTYTMPTADSFNNGTDHYGQWYRIKAIEKNGSRESWSNDVIIYFEPVIYIPNVFSPGANKAENLLFKPSNSGLKTYNLTVYNRWGQIVFETENSDLGWDGNYLGKEAPSGVYVYYVKYQDFRDKNYATKGTLHLLR